VTGWSLRALALAAAVAGIALAVLIGGDQPKPYVVTAIDYHFHDAHPSFPIAPGRDLIVKNESSNLHNVTIPAIGYSQDVQPGQELVIPDVASLFPGPGRYSFHCIYHEDRGMTGLLVIADG
jgi:plastocyanin